MKRRVTLLIGAATFLGALLRLWAIGRQWMTADEILSLPTAVSYVRTGWGAPLMPFHPELRNLLVYAASRAFGAGLITYKGWSLFFGILAVPLLGLLVWRLTHSTVAASLAALLLALDPTSIYWSRSALQDGWTVFFALAGVLVTVEIARSEKRSRWLWLPLVAGAIFGLGTAAKFYVIPVELAAAGYLAWTAGRRRRPADAAWAVVAILGGSLVAFVLTYAPWFAAGHSAAEWFPFERSVVATMATASIQAPYNRFTHAWQWFVVPFVGWNEIEFGWPLPSLGLAVANPFTWLVVLPSSAYLFWMRRDALGMWLLQLFFWAAYVPYLLISRHINTFGALVALPFAFALVALAAADLSRRWGSRIAIGYAALVVVTSLALYPGAIGHGADTPYLAPLVRYQSSAPLLPMIQEQLGR